MLSRFRKELPLGRVRHYDPSCRVCVIDQPGLYRTAAPVPPPYPNPEYRPGMKGMPKGGPDRPGFSEGGQHGHHWYHGTTFSPDEEDEDDHEDSRASGGRLRAPTDMGIYYNSRAGTHWNTDLGVHFSSLHEVAKRTFAGDGKDDIDSRVAHASLHMANPIHFDNERDFGKHAIDWARKNGHKFLPEAEDQHETFKRGNYDSIHGNGAYYSYLHDHLRGDSAPQIRQHISEIDKGGVKKSHPLKSVDSYLALHPDREEIVEGYHKHLRDQGHDGVTYGNDYEGPSGHTSAIAFPGTPITVHKWEYLHKDSQNMPATPQEARQRRLDAREPDEGQMKLFGRRVAAKDPNALKYKLWQSPKTKKDPDQLGTHTLTAVHPKHGPVGSLQYVKRADHLQVEMLSVPRQHRGNGYAAELMDEMQRRHPGMPIDHGERTDAGQDWWDKYSLGKEVVNGRTIASLRTSGTGWEFEHFPSTEPGLHRVFGRPPGGEPRQHSLMYQVKPGNKLKFDEHLVERLRTRGGDEAVQHLQQAALTHHPGSTLHSAEDEAPPAPPKPQRRVYYHGTTRADMTHVLPANSHGGGTIFHSVTDPDYAYATHDLGHAWEYAQKAFDTAPHGRPRVYQVRPIGGHQHVEEDPQWDDVRNISRGNNSSDRRSKKGWEVVREMKAPRHVRDSYTDDEWGEDDHYASLRALGNAETHVAPDGWTMQHHPHKFYPNTWDAAGGPREEPRRHIVRYEKTDEGKINFRPDGWDSLDDVRERHGDADADRMKHEILKHHNAEEHDPPVEMYHEPEPPAPTKSKAPPKVYYHGTHVPGVTHILPADHHGKPVLYDETDSRYAYATPNLDDAWDYATDAAAHARDRGHPHTRPRVYAVHPIGGHKHVEVDPEYDEHGGWRGNNPDDKRSKKGFRVVKEMEAPDHVRKDHPDEDWSN